MKILSPLVLANAGLVVLGLAANPANAAVELAVDPARPHAGQTFVLAIGGLASCPHATVDVDSAPVGGGTLDVGVSDGCAAPPEDFLLEIPVGPLATGTWTIEVTENDVPQGALGSVTIAPLPFALRTEAFVVPLGAQPVVVTFEGHSLPCWDVGEARRDGRLLTLDARFECNILPPPPIPFEIPVELPFLEPGIYRAQVEGEDGETLGSTRFEIRAAEACVPDGLPPFGQVLCLHGGRFRVTAEWSTGGTPAPAVAVPITRDSGAFAFFALENLEVLVKVLDACGLESPRFWVFAAGLTNVDVLLRVEDTHTGEVWEGANPPGRAFPPILDVDAFATCGAG